ncbi:SIR2 family histone deacetylase [Sporothrix brasiliensis 5110]|uniref:SIR2 family histone deacetylase n=1 Tax=Sporothrix brasiliensis 5110 TaxID=1398154 RepID=A0A0C2EZ94_9PEZI|nr:SIR2 family histone deacetylase [Sporothrix brasiliensis 5110]KIH91824.1 SIR2 family histone deacetylase [Sporothrix brasiliensis 5110]
MAVRRPLLRIPYTDVFAPPRIIPRHATTLSAAVEALSAFMTAPPRPGLPSSTVVLTGAGLSVASGLADYRGENGTYRVNKTYRPIYFHEFLASHEARKRYWTRSFLGWTTLHEAKPNTSHYALRDLGRLGYVHSVITQNVDSFHHAAHPDLPSTVELHGYLRATVCTTCYREYPRDTFQDELARLNPIWAEFLADAIAAGAFAPEDPTTGAPARREPASLSAIRGVRTNPDGDVDLPNAPYTTFRYPPCAHCLANPPVADDGTTMAVEVDADGAWALPHTSSLTDSGTNVRLPGILKPAVIMFGESISPSAKHAAEAAVDGAGRLLVLATSLATYSAWRLAKRAKDRGMPIAVVNMGGVRGEDAFFADLDDNQPGAAGVRVEVPTDAVLPPLVDELHRLAPGGIYQQGKGHGASQVDPALFRDMLS